MDDMILSQLPASWNTVDAAGGWADVKDPRRPMQQTLCLQFHFLHRTSLPNSLSIVLIWDWATRQLRQPERGEAALTLSSWALVARDIRFMEKLSHLLDQLSPVPGCHVTWVQAQPVRGCQTSWACVRPEGSHPGLGRRVRETI